MTSSSMTSSFHIAQVTTCMTPRMTAGCCPKRVEWNIFISSKLCERCTVRTEVNMQKGDLLTRWKRRFLRASSVVGGERSLQGYTWVTLEANVQDLARPVRACLHRLEGGCVSRMRTVIWKRWGEMTCWKMQWIRQVEELQKGVLNREYHLYFLCKCIGTSFI